MDYIIALVAVALSALANGTGVILEKVGVDQQPKRLKLGGNFASRLARNKFYVGGLVLDIIGWVLTLVALRQLPLFLVQSIVASNIVVTALLDQIILGRKLSRTGYGLIGVILSGLFLLAYTAPPQTVSRNLTDIYVWAGLVILLIVGLMGLLAMQFSQRVSAVALSVTAGFAFGSAAIAGRVLVGNVTLLGFLTSPLTYILAAGGTLGMVWFTIALRRSTATMVNALTLSVQTVVPAAFGIIVLGDKVRDGFELVMIIALGLSLVGSLALGALRHTTDNDVLKAS
jgi:drug/metabolite transporter (DMT)-like permease